MVTGSPVTRGWIGNRYGVLNSYNNGAGTINLGNNVTVNVTDTDKYAKGVVIQEITVY